MCILGFGNGKERSMKKTFRMMLILSAAVMLFVSGCACADMTEELISNQPETLVELSCGKVEYLNYQCTLPDGRLLLTGGTRSEYSVRTVYR